MGLREGQKYGKLLIIPKYYKYVLPFLTLIVSPTMNLISETHNYVRGGVCIYDILKVFYNYPRNIILKCNTCPHSKEFVFELQAIYLQSVIKLQTTIMKFFLRVFI